MSVWTLLPIDDFIRTGNHFEIDVETAFKQNHMSLLLNDRLLGLKPPLEFHLTMKEVPEHGEVEHEPEDATARQLSLVTTSVRLFAGGKEMVDIRERELVWFLIRHAS